MMEYYHQLRGILIQSLSRSVGNCSSKAVFYDIKYQYKIEIQSQQDGTIMMANIWYFLPFLPLSKKSVELVERVEM